GEVWAGRDRSLRRDVAVKLLAMQDAASPDLPARFEREAVAAAQINHPNVVALYDRGVHEDMLFLVMEKVEGGNLAEHLRDEGPMDPDRALAIAGEVCAALDAAHTAGVIHYDIKPQNIMITPAGGVKVVDFGIAGFLQATFSVARSSQLIPAGTPEYGAPEQFLSERGNVRSDLYALGAVLFALLAGHPPVTGHNALALVRRKLDEDAPSLSDVRPGTPAALVVLVAELLDRDAERRPASAGEVRQRLRQLREDAGRTTALAQPAATVRQPPRTVQESDSDDTYTFTWTAQEPLADYPGTIAGLGRSRKATQIRVAVAGVLWVLIGMLAIAVLNFNADGDRDAWDQATLQGVIGVATLGLVGCVVHAGITGARARDHERRSSWTLTIGPHHIRTTHGSRHKTYPWEQIRTATVVAISGTSPGDAYLGLHIRPESGRLRNAAPLPAGWPEPRPGRPRLGASSAPAARRDALVPVCVLGPMNPGDRFDFAEAMERYGDQRWTPTAALQ
ncbi:serine/threonine protein kinase, partial [Streptomyces sp. A7024]